MIIQLELFNGQHRCKTIRRPYLRAKVQECRLQDSWIKSLESRALPNADVYRCLQVKALPDLPGLPSQFTRISYPAEIRDPTNCEVDLKTRKLTLRKIKVTKSVQKMTSFWSSSLKFCFQKSWIKTQRLSTRIETLGNVDLEECELFILQILRWKRTSEESGEFVGVS